MITTLTIPDKDFDLIRKIELDIAIEIKRICDKCDIRYSLTAGTLLGALRHQGFIPWDDDIDIAMKREAYDKFLAIAPSELDEKYEVFNYETNPNCEIVFTKIVAKGTVLQDKYAKSPEVSCGVFVDIFPYDNQPDSEIGRKVQVIRTYLLEKRILIKGGYNFRKKSFKKVLYTFLRAIDFASKQKLFMKYRKVQGKYNNRPTKYVTGFDKYSESFRNTFSTELLDNYTQLEFEGIKFSVFADYRGYLRQKYGDYMELPPLEQRNHAHGLVYMDLRAFGGSEMRL